MCMCYYSSWIKVHLWISYDMKRVTSRMTWTKLCRICDVLHLIDLLRLLDDSGVLLFVHIMWNEEGFIRSPKEELAPFREIIYKGNTSCSARTVMNRGLE